MSRAVNRFGYTIVPNWKLPNFAMATRLREIFSHFKIDTVIDVGANRGQYARFLRDEVGFTGMIESFEPVPELVRVLQAQAALDPQWAVHPLALGANAGSLALNIMDDPVYSSFRTPVPDQDKKHSRNTITNTELVRVSTLDLEFPPSRDLQHTYLKLDTQGFDLEALRGGERVVSEIPALQTEVSFKPLYQEMPDYRQSIAAFEKYGFAVADFFLVTTYNRVRAMEFDCIMVR
jgi:FkbM family methyltransferase